MISTYIYISATKPNLVSFVFLVFIFFLGGTLFFIIVINSVVVMICIFIIIVIIPVFQFPRVSTATSLHT